ncbi:2OG-Fe(II) oxygenase [Streptomyces aurantiacus]|uniref:Prolyl 4-hydroxylase alpha subunit Fe(2+) 2OG dioxygenase domain-containing protein n=1 Tax=Streptomyces aurantiacus JA 4570 TaxID=1286094 RepID=S3ZTE5_9ACTN|nr:2OG-Fe(II) oxygenase [Streptomyces aurantiacus]EPH46691.1 hypothetical protein STRAU_0244 [Streptomyces aurantiacus JA 4570]
MINSEAVLQRLDEPYVYYTADDVVSPHDLRRLNAETPDLAIFDRRVKRGSEHRKEYNMWRCEPAENGRRTQAADKLPAAWSELVDSTLSTEFREWLTAGTGVDVRTVRTTVGLYVFEDGDFTGIDSGKLEKALSFGLYLNEDWQRSYGGAFQVFTHKAPDAEPVRSLVPIGGRCVTMTPTESTWHRIERVDTGGRVSRLLLMVEFWRD